VTARRGFAMLKMAVLFAACALVLTMFAPDLLATIMVAPVVAPSRPLAAAPPPALARAAVGPVTREHEIAIPADGLGQYSTDVMLNGQSVHMLIDTGASLVFVSAAVADRLGIAPPSNAQHVQVRTANGAAMATLVTLNSVAIGPVYVPDVQALIADRSAGDVNLVGESLLARLGGVEQRSGYLYLRQ
jgi:aspartyl protease family protein